MTDQRNMLLAIVLSVLVLLGWTAVSDKYFPTAQEPTVKVEKGKTVATAQPGADPAVDTPAALRNREIVLGETPRVAIETPRLSGSINLKGARIDDLLLTTQTETLADDSGPIRLLSPSGASGAYFANFGWTGQGLALPAPDTVWQASGTRLTQATPVTLSWDNGGGQRFVIRLSVDDGYMFTAEQTVENRSGAPIAARPYSLINRSTKSADASSWTSHVGPVGVFNGSANYDWDYETVAEEGQQLFSTTGGWLGFGDKYWLTAVIPAQSGGAEAAFRPTPGGGFQADITPESTIVGPGSASRYTSRLFAGAKEIRLLDRYTDAGIARFDKAIDWGWFEWFMKPIFALLNFLFDVTRNFGVAIILLVVIVRLLLFPIAQKQFASMAGMRVVQPKMKELQERYKDDRAKLQQEMLKLYKEEKVNPLAGCLPILIQIPIFYALYKVLMVAVEMRHQPFALWIKDLAAPDPMTPVNLFGFLPFTPPSFLAIGVLPILVGITQYLSFKLNPPPTDPVQRQVFGLMPWILMFIMAPFAAGLQLYWATNNILTILQQKWLYSRHPGMKAAAAAEKAAK